MENIINIENVIKDIENIAEDIKDLAENIENLIIEDIEDIESVISDNKDIVKNVENIITDSKDIIQNVESVITDSNDIVENVESVITDSNDIVENVESVITDSNDIVENVESVITDSKDVVENVQDIIQDVESVITDSRDIVEDVESGITDSKDDSKDVLENPVIDSENKIEEKPIVKNVWKARTLEHRKSNTQLPPDTLRDLNGYLNRLSIENYGKLSQNICSLEIEDAEMLDKFCNIIFNKAVEEADFCKMYANLISRLQDKCVTGSKTKNMIFRYAFISLCHKEFTSHQKEQYKIENADGNETKEEREMRQEKESLYHRRVIGTLHLLSALYQVKIIPASIVKEHCLKHLLTIAEKNINTDGPESLCKMIKNLKNNIKDIGLLEDEKADYIQRLLCMKTIFKNLQNMRIAFLIEDAIEIISQNDCPESIQQVIKPISSEEEIKRDIYVPRSKLNTDSNSSNDGKYKKTYARDDTKSSNNSGNRDDSRRSNNNGSRDDSRRSNNNGSRDDSRRSNNNGSRDDSKRSNNNGSRDDSRRSNNNGSRDDSRRSNNNGSRDDSRRSNNNGSRDDSRRSNNNGQNNKW
jgi:ElaB/YqjD/DUF883 family membrane-anchored ribosome-binding protein